MIWCFPWSTGRCHNCFEKSQQAIISPQANLSISICNSNKTLNPDHILCHCIKEDHRALLDLQTIIIEPEFCWTLMCIYWYSLVSLMYVWLKKEKKKKRKSVFSQDILTWSLHYHGIYIYTYISIYLYSVGVIGLIVQTLCKRYIQ